MSDAFLVLTFEALFHRLDWTWSCLVLDWVVGFGCCISIRTIYSELFPFQKEQDGLGYLKATNDQLTSAMAGLIALSVEQTFYLDYIPIS